MDDHARDSLQRERARVLESNEAVIRRFRDEGPGAVLQDARRNAEAAVAIFDPEDPALARVLMVLGAICDVIGEEAEADSADRQARDILLHANDPADRLELGTVLGNMAVREDGRLDLVAATTLREQALSAYRGVLPEIDQRTVTSLQYLVATWEARRERTIADRLIAEHVALATSQGADPVELSEHGSFMTLVPFWLNHTATRLQTEGKLDAAEQFFRQAVDSAEVRRPDDYLAQSVLQSNLAWLLLGRGEYTEAQALLITALDNLDVEGRDNTDEEITARVRLLSNLGVLLYRTNDLRNALVLNEEVLAMRQARLNGDDPLLADSLCNLGLVRGAMDDLPGAWALMVRAYRIREHESSSEAVDLVNNLGWIARASGEARLAREFYEEALKRRRQLNGDRHPSVAESLNNLGVACLNDGETDLARRLLQEGLDLRRAVYGPQHPDVVASLVNLATALVVAGDLDGAEFQLTTAWTTHRMLDPEMKTPATSTVLFGLAHLSVLRGDAASAARQLEAALDHENRLTRSILALGSERARLIRLTSIRNHSDALISVALDHTVDSATLARRAYRQVVRRKAIGIDFIAFQRATVRAGANSERTEVSEELEQARDNLGRAVLDQVHAEVIAVRRARVEALEANLARSMPDTWLTADDENDLDHVLAALPAKALLVDFVRCGVWDPAGRPGSQWPRERYVAFVLHTDYPSPRIIDIGDAALIDDAISAFRAKMLGPSQAREPVTQSTAAPAESTAGEELRRLLIDALGPIPEVVRRIVIVPDGALHLLSFAALPMGGDRRLIDVFEVSTLTSARDLLAPSRSSDASMLGLALVVADPDYDLVGTDAAPTVDIGATDTLVARGLPEASELRPLIRSLPATAIEARAVGKVLDVRPVIGRRADKRHLAKARRPSVLHLATHGYFRRRSAGSLRRELLGGDTAGMLPAGVLDDPLLRCGLVLAGANRWLRTGELDPRAGDGFLTGLDVLGLDLDGTQLVVLSACDTGRGEIVDGEGVLGLSRAFTGAGAESLVMSLWKVPDEQTAALMTGFYQRLAQGDEIPTALRVAQLAIRDSDPHPRYWAAFISQGSAAALSWRSGSRHNHG